MKATDIKKFERLYDIELPKDDRAENGVIGTLLCHPEYIYKTEYLKPTQFYNREYGCIYHIINTLMNKGITNIDNFMILSEIEANKAFKNIIEEVDGIKNDISAWLDNLKLVSRPDVESYEHVAKNVVTNAFKRDTYIKLKEMGNKILTSTEDINNINYELQTEVADFSKIYICNKEVLTLGEQVDEIWEGVLAKRNNGFFGFPSKFKELNNYATYEKTEVNLFSAPAKTCKSQLLSNEAWNLAISGVPTLYIDREMSTENHLLRMISFLTGIENRRVKTGQVSLVEEKLIKEKLEYIKKLQYIHLYKPVTDMSEMYMNIKNLKLKHGIEFLVYDYIKANDGSDGDKEYQKLGRLTDWLKNDIAGSLDLAVLGACQSDRTGMKVADSSKIERNCSTLSYLTRKTKEEFVTDGGIDAGNIKLRVAFSRNGAIMDEDQYLNLHLNGDICRIEQAKIAFSNNDGLLPY